MSLEQQLATIGNELADVKKELQAVQKVTATVILQLAAQDW